MDRVKQLFLLCCACLLGGTGASATTIDFNTLPASNGGSTTFTTYTENNFTVTATSGLWNVNNSTFGDPIPSIFLDTSTGGNVVVTGGAGPFTFSGTEIGTYDNNALGYTITGSLLGSQVFTVSGSAIGAFAEYGTGYSADTIDQLSIHFTSFNENLDNIVVNDTTVAATPEPESLALVLTGAAGMAGVLRRRIANGLRR